MPTEYLTQLEAENGRLRAALRAVTQAEHAISAAYVRLRRILGAMDPPSTELPALSAYVEETARTRLRPATTKSEMRYFLIAYWWLQDGASGAANFRISYRGFPSNRQIGLWATEDNPRRDIVVTNIIEMTEDDAAAYSAVDAAAYADAMLKARIGEQK